MYISGWHRLKLYEDSVFVVMLETRTQEEHCVYRLIGCIAGQDTVYMLMIGRTIKGYQMLLKSCKCLGYGTVTYVGLRI